MSYIEDKAMTTDGERRRTVRLAIGVAIAAGAATALGFAMGLGREGDAATGWGVLAGAGAVVTLAALAALLLLKTSGVGDEAGPRDRMQDQRVWTVSMTALAGLAFLVSAVFSVGPALEGEATFGDHLRLLLPVVYAWVVSATVLGWDHQSRTQRGLLEDELTVALRARAITAGFVVLMAGVTISLGVMLVEVHWGAVSLLSSLTLAGAVVGLRFAWLDREMSRGV